MEFRRYLDGPLRLAFGTPLLRVDLVNPNAKIQTTLNKRATPPGTFSSVPILGEVFEFDFIPRNSDATVWNLS